MSADALRRYMTDEGWDHGVTLLDEALEEARREAQGIPLIDVELLAEALQALWRVRNTDGSFVWDLPVPPNEQTARALAAQYIRLSESSPVHEHGWSVALVAPFSIDPDKVVAHKCACGAIRESSPVEEPEQPEAVKEAR